MNEETLKLIKRFGDTVPELLRTAYSNPMSHSAVMTI